MKTLEELLQTVEVIEIDINRVMDVPESVRKVGTQFDHEVTTLVFHAPRYSQNGEDLSNTIPYVSFYKANKDVGQSLCENLTVDPTNNSMIYFTWTLKRPATDVKGALPFVICMRRTEGDELDMAWHSELNTDLRVSEGIDCDIEDFDPEFKDEVTKILLDITAVVEKIKKDAESGAFDGQDVTHRWDGTTLIVTSASGTSSSDLKGDNATLEIGPLKSTEKVNNLKVYFVTAAEYDELIDSDDFDESALYITPETAYVTHEWNGTVLTISSNAGTSSVDLKGDKGDKGDDYVLTEADKEEIAGMVELPTDLAKLSDVIESKTEERLLNIEFDGNLENCITYVQVPENPTEIYCKVSEQALPLESANNTNFKMIFTSANGRDDNGNYTYGDTEVDSITVYHSSQNAFILDCTNTFVYNVISETLQVGQTSYIDKGIWFLLTLFGDGETKRAYPSKFYSDVVMMEESVNKIKEELIPDTVAMKSDIPGYKTSELLNIEWDGGTLDDVSEFEYQGETGVLQFFKVSDEIISTGDLSLLQHEIVLNTTSGLTINTGTVMRVGVSAYGIIPSEDNPTKYPMIVVSQKQHAGNGDTEFGLAFGEGVYFARLVSNAKDSIMGYPKRLFSDEYMVENVKKLDEKALPDGVATKEWVSANSGGGGLLTLMEFDGSAMKVEGQTFNVNNGAVQGETVYILSDDNFRTLCDILRRKIVYMLCDFLLIYHPTNICLDDNGEVGSIDLSDVTGMIDNYKLYSDSYYNSSGGW